MSEAIQLHLQHPEVPMNHNAAGNQVAADSTAIIEEIFKMHFNSLHTYAGTILKDEAAAEEIVQNVFFKLWERKDQVLIKESAQAYLYRAVHNDCLNHLRHHKVRAKHHAHVAGTAKEYEEAMDPAALRELQQKIDDAMNELPEQCRTIFQLGRVDDLRYRTIADQLGISVKTVDNQMAKALRLLRTKLKDFFPLIGVLFINVENLLS